MRLGLWGARMDNSGLGQQTLGFYQHMAPDKTMVVDISVFERLPERVLTQYPDRYGDNPHGQVTFIQGIPNESDMRAFLRDLDVVFIAESSYNMDFYRIAQEMGVKTANQINWEFFDWAGNGIWQAPDMFIAPSTWHYDELKAASDNLGAKCVYLPCPVDREKIKRRHFSSATSFVHIAGRPAAHDRNGTYTFLNAITMADGQLSGTVYTQDKTLAQEIREEFPRVKVKENISDYSQIYKKGSVLVLPRRYGGNCLPLNEALSAGMPVIMSDLSPQNDLLPHNWLVKARLMDTEFAPRFKIPVYECLPAEIMLKMLWFKSLSNQDMARENQRASDLAETISWEVMAPKYREVLEALCNL